MTADESKVEVECCPNCGSEGPFDGQGYFDRNYTIRSSENGFKPTSMCQCWYQIHCPECGAKFRILEIEKEHITDE